MQVPGKDVCYRALESRDARFDGLIYVAIKTTGIYCRPVCPARTAKYTNCTFFASAAAAQEAGYRPCLRCRPEIAPELPSSRGTSSTVSRAFRLISEGALDGEDAGVDALAERLGVGERQLRRLFVQHLGASPVAVAQTRRVLFAKQLLHDTRMPMAEIALAAGFGSTRRFNETFRQLFGRAPSALRRKTVGAEGQITKLYVRYRAPYDWDAMLAFLSARAIPGVEVVENSRYLRTVELDGAVGTIEVGHDPDRQSLVICSDVSDVRSLPGIVARVRRQFDLGADIETINAHLSGDRMLRPMLAQRPGLRIPGAWDGFETAVRAVLGQQITVAAARNLAGRFVALYGRRLPESDAGRMKLSYLFPTPKRLLLTNAGHPGMPAARTETLKALAEAAVKDPTLLHPGGSMDQALERLCRIPGIGPWTAQYIALRALGEVDAFPATDVALLRGASAADATQQFTPTRLLERAESWRPWRAYAAQHLWAADAARVPRGAK